MNARDLRHTVLARTVARLLLCSVAAGCDGDGTHGMDAASGDASVDGGAAPADASDPDASADAGPRPDGGDASVAFDGGPDEEPDVIGWAAVPGYGVDTTTGGGDLEPVVVTTAGELSSALDGTEPRVIHASGTITGDFTVGSNKTLAGQPGASIVGSLAFSGSVNVIVRDLTIVGWNCADTTDCGDGRDAITVRSEAHHLWFDHLDISDGSDGNLDIIGGSDLVTVSWTRFHYSAEREPDTGAPHRYSNLFGSSDGATGDAGRLRVTLHHCWWADGVASRMPRVRYGLVHVFNNLYTATGNGSCIRAAWDASVLVENNAFYEVQTPIEVRSHSDATALESRGNLYEGTTGTIADDRNAPVFTPPYPYTLEPAEDVAARVMSGVGPR